MRKAFAVLVAIVLAATPAVAQEHHGALADIAEGTSLASFHG